MYALIHPVRIEDAWLKVAPWIALAIGSDPEDWIDLEHIKPRLLCGAMQLWIGHEPGTEKIESVLITEGTLIGKDPTLIVRWATIKGLNAHLQDIGLLERWAMDNGFSKLQVWGRPGFSRILKPLGFSKKFEVTERTLDRGVH